MKRSEKKWIVLWSRQAGMIDPKRYIGDIVLKNRINVLEEQIRELKREKEQMEKENVRLRKSLKQERPERIKNFII